MIYQTTDLTRLPRIMQLCRLNAGKTRSQAAQWLGTRRRTIEAIESCQIDKVAIGKVFALLGWYGCGVRVEVYEPPKVETLADMIEALGELGYSIDTGG